MSDLSVQVAICGPCFRLMKRYTKFGAVKRALESGGTEAVLQVLAGIRERHSERIRLGYVPEDQQAAVCSCVVDPAGELKTLTAEFLGEPAPTHERANELFSRILSLRALLSSS